MLEVENLVKIYKKRKVVKYVSFSIKRGKVIGLLGPNGAGKTTSFYMTLGLVSADEGKVFLDKQEITHLPMYKRARLGIAYLPQEASIFRKMSVAENIESVLELHYKKRTDIIKKRNELIDKLNLDKVVDQKGFTLSGGERRRCEVARALASNPNYILLDEPFAGVDPIAISDIQKLISWLAKQGLGVLITDHNVRETLKVTHSSYVIYAGEILAQGTPKTLVNNPTVRGKYLGKSFHW